MTCLAFSGDASVLGAGGADGSWRCWSTRDGGLLAANRQHGRVSCLAVSAGGQTLASASPDGTLRVWAVPGGRLVTVFQFPNAEPISRLAFARDAGRLCAAGANGRLVIWDVLHEQLLCSLAGPQGVISDLAFSPDGQSLAVTSASGAVWVRAVSRSISQRRPAVLASPNRVTPVGHWLVDVLRKVGVAAWAP